MISIYPKIFFELWSPYRGENHKQFLLIISISYWQKYKPLLSITIVNMPAILAVQNFIKGENFH